jgi:hypothetical protein
LSARDVPPIFVECFYALELDLGTVAHIRFLFETAAAAILI